MAPDGNTPPPRPLASDSERSVATANMRRDAKAVAEGVKEGLNRDKDRTVDLNNASKEQLLSLLALARKGVTKLVDLQKMAVM